MEIIPAIDLKGGHCVRLRQGEFTQVETYTDDPVKYAVHWQREGATRLHVVDLDGARIGVPQPQNLEVIRQISRRLHIPIEMGGGIRSAEIVERVLRSGVDRVIIGTTMAQNADLASDLLMQYGDKIVIDVAAKDGYVAVKGWQESLAETAVAFAMRMVAMGAKRILFTDVGRDGMLGGVNTAALCEMLAAVSVPVIASGGVGTIDDIRALASIKASNLEAAVVGKALYAGTLKLADAIAVAS